MIPVYVSNGAFITRRNGRDYRLISTYAPQLRADGVEFMMYAVWNDEVAALRKYLTGAGVPCPVMHLDKLIGETLAEHGLAARGEAMRMLERDLDTAREIGARKLVLHLWNGPMSDSRFDEVFPLCGELYEKAAKLNLNLTVENVTCVQNVCLDHLMRIRAAYPNARFTFDTKMALLHGENALLKEDRYRFLLEDGAIAHLHLNDSRPSGEGRSPILHLGDGVIDFGAFFALLQKTGYAGTATVESTSVNEDGSVDVERLNRSLDAARRGLNEMRSV